MHCKDGGVAILYLVVVSGCSYSDKKNSEGLRFNLEWAKSYTYWCMFIKKKTSE